jgi:membrane protease YdiL (CAAX protease family)
VVYAAGWLPVNVLVVLWLAAIGCGLKLRADGWPKQNKWLAIRAPAKEWRQILLTFAFAVPLFVLAVWLFAPDSLFALPRQRPLIWLLVMLLYPLLSVYPQEIIFRAFFFHRYRTLFGDGAGLVVSSAAAFGFVHIIFRNWLAVGLTLAGGILFARSYRRTRALLFVAVEHALYGCLIFTVGLGHYFFEGTMRLFR